MLPRRHRVTTASDFRAVTRNGARAGGSCVVISARPSSLSDLAAGRAQPAQGDRLAPEGAARAGRAQGDPVRWRCGFIVSKAVGNAVVRHRTQRRLRHIVAGLMREGAVEVREGHRLDLVVRALPAAAEAAHDELVSQVRSTLLRAVGKAERRRREAGSDGG